MDKSFQGFKLLCLTWLLIGDITVGLPPPEPISTLRGEYGLLYQFLGGMIHGVNQFWIMIGYQLPKLYYRSEVEMLPGDFCDDLEVNTLLQFVCSKMWPMAIRNHKRIQVLQAELDNIAYQDMPSILPGFKPEDVEYSIHTEAFEGQTDTRREPVTGYKEGKSVNETRLAELKQAYEARYAENPEMDRLFNNHLASDIQTGPKKKKKKPPVKRTVVDPNMKDKTEVPLNDMPSILIDESQVPVTPYTEAQTPPVPLQALQAETQVEDVLSKPDGKIRKKRSTKKQLRFTLGEIDNFVTSLDQKQIMNEQEFRNMTRKYKPRRKKRFIGILTGLAGLAIEGAKFGMDMKKKKSAEKAIKTLFQHVGRLDGQIKHLRKDMVSIAEATFADIDRIMEMLRFVHEEINFMYFQISRLRHLLREQKAQINDIQAAIAMMTEIWTRILDWQEREMSLLMHLITEMDHLLDALDNLSNGLLSHTVIPPHTMANLLRHTKETLILNYPEFELVLDETYQYYNIPIGSFSYVDGILAIQIPLFIKPKLQTPLLLYQLHTVPVPFHMNENLMEADESLYTYTWLKPTTTMLGMSKDTYVGLEDTDLKNCAYLNKVYICQDVFLMKHRDYHTCESAIYFNQAYAEIKEKCQIDYYPHLEPEPRLLDQGDQILLAGLKDKWTYYCHANDQVPSPAGEGHYVIVNKTDLCRCSITAGEYYVQQNIAHCTENSLDSKLEFGYTVNQAVLIHMYEEIAERPEIQELQLFFEPYPFDPEEPEIWDISEDDVLERDDEDIFFNMIDMARQRRLEIISYVDHGEKASNNDEYNEWWKNESKGNKSKRFLFICGIVTLTLVVIITGVIIGYLALRGKLSIIDTMMARIMGIALMTTQPQAIQAYQCNAQVGSTTGAMALIDETPEGTCKITCIPFGSQTLPNWRVIVLEAIMVIMTITTLYLTFITLRWTWRQINRLTGNLTRPLKLKDVMCKDRLEFYLVLDRHCKDGTTTKFKFLLKNLKGEIEHLNLEGKFKLGDVTYDARCCWSYIHIMWSSLNMKFKDVPLDLPSTIQVNWIQAFQIKRFLASTVKNPEENIKVHLYMKETWTQAWHRLIEDPVELTTGPPSLIVRYKKEGDQVDIVKEGTANQDIVQAHTDECYPISRLNQLREETFAQTNPQQNSTRKLH